MNDFENGINSIEEIIRKAEIDANVYDELTIRIMNTKTKTRFYYCNSEGKKSYLNNTKTELIRKLAQKRYANEVLNYLKKECPDLKNVSKTLHLLSQLTIVYEKMEPSLKEYVNPYVLSDEQYAEKWLNERNLDKDSNTYNFGSTEFFTDKGERVRSKSELIIANKLKNYGIPYKYENPVILSNGLKYYPDFTVLNKRTRQEYYIEHCGMMDNVDYRSSLYKKLANYAIGGITNGKNLITILEDSSMALSTLYLDMIIKNVLL